MVRWQGVTTWLYGSRDTLKQGFLAVVTQMGEQAMPLGGIGDDAKVVTVSGSRDFLELSFVRCAALVHVRMVGYSNIDDIVVYAERLDARLRTVVC